MFQSRKPGTRSDRLWLRTRVRFLSSRRQNTTNEWSSMVETLRMWGVFLEAIWSRVMYYCWWLKSCTTWDVRNPKDWEELPINRCRISAINSMNIYESDWCSRHWEICTLWYLPINIDHKKFSYNEMTTIIIDYRFKHAMNIHEEHWEWKVSGHMGRSLKLLIQENPAIRRKLPPLQPSYNVLQTDSEDAQRCCWSNFSISIITRWDML